MPSPTRLAGALDALFAELAETVAWESEIAAEARRAAGRRERLAFSVRATIGTLPEADRPPALHRLRETLGAPEPEPGTPRRTDRTRIVQDWLARRETPDFHIAELRTHLELMGHRFTSGYLPTLLARWTRAGVLTKVGYGRYRVNEGHLNVAMT